jgi:hypothetical protein
MLTTICASYDVSYFRVFLACGRSEAIAWSEIRSAIQGSVMGGIREGLGDAEGADRCKPDANLRSRGLQLSY